MAFPKKKEKKVKEQDPNKLGGGTLLIWSSSAASASIQVVLIGYLTMYLTNALEMNVTLVGTILMATKILDGFTDIFAGYIVDRTNTKIGKGRPYDICVMLIWLATWALYSVPAGWSTFMKCVYIIICYTLSQSVFRTFITASNTVYMVRAFNNEQKYIKINSWGALISTFGVVIFNIIFPMFYADVLYDAAGWSSLVGFIAIPLGIIGLLRFLFIPEKYVVEDTTQKASFQDVITLLKTNKNIYPVGVLQFVVGISSNIAVGSYYFQYIVGNVSITGIMSMFTVIAMLSLAFYPALLKHISTKQLIQYSLLLSLGSGLIGFFALDNLVMIGIAATISGFVSLPMSYMFNMLIIDCADYNECNGNKRMEATLSSVTGFMNKVGSAFGTFLTGILLGAVGFVSGAETQSDSVLLMIRAATYLIPMAFSLFAAFLLTFYKLDKMRPQMNEKLKELRGQNAEAAQQA